MNEWMDGWMNNKRIKELVAPTSLCAWGDGCLRRERVYTVSLLMFIFSSTRYRRSVKTQGNLERGRRYRQATSVVVVEVGVVFRRGDTLDPGIANDHPRRVKMIPRVNPFGTQPSENSDLRSIF